MEERVEQDRGLVLPCAQSCGSMLGRCRVLLADAEAQVRSALGLALSQQTDVEVVGQAASQEELLRQAEARSPEILLVAWEMMAKDPRGLLAKLRAQEPNLWIVVLSGQPEARSLALEAGADAFVSKVEPPDRLLETIRGLATQLNGGSSGAYTRSSLPR